MVYKDSGGLHQDRHQSNRRFPDVHAFGSRVSSKEYDNGRYIYEVLGYENGGSHVDFEGGVVEGTRLIELEPFRIDGSAAGRVNGCKLSAVLINLQRA